jgi:hypothetical protein
MFNPQFIKPESIANDEFQIQIVDTLLTLKTRSSIGFAGFSCQLNRTLVIFSNCVSYRSKATTNRQVQAQCANEFAALD